jgi:methionyl-tRNA formyltransferase
MMSAALRVAIASYGLAQFHRLHDTLANLGHIPATYIVSRSMRPSGTPETGILNAISEITEGLPSGMDLLLPGNADTMASMLAGYSLDLLLVFGFNWRLPQEILELPRLGVLNVHPSALPRYRGPSPVLWAIRNGDPSIGVTIHRMNERIDAGPVLAQAEGISLPDQVTSEDAWQLIKAALPGLLEIALNRVLRGDPGTPQDEREATYAGFPPAEWYSITWQLDRRSTHHQIRVLRYLNGGQGPLAEINGRRIRINSASLEASIGIRVECADGPLWITSSDESPP